METRRGPLPVPMSLPRSTEREAARLRCLSWHVPARGAQGRLAARLPARRPGPGLHAHRFLLLSTGCRGFASFAVTRDPVTHLSPSWGPSCRCTDTVGGNTRPGARLTCVLFPCSVPWLPRPLALSPLPPEVPRRPRGHPRSRPRCRLGAGRPHPWATGTAASPAHPPHVSLTAYRVPQNHGILRVQRDPKVERSRPLALLYTRGVGSRAG